MTQTANATVKYGDVFWITGLAGAGKSTIARALAAELRISANNVVLLDGDAFRSIFTDVGYSPKDRLENAWRIARTSNMLSMQYIHVVAATVSLYDEVRDWLRTSIPTYHEIFVNPSMETLMRRDQKGLYSGAAAGTVQNVAGVNVEVELPRNADLEIKNDTEQSDISNYVAQILALRGAPK